MFEGLWAGEGEVDTLIDARGLRQISDTGALEAICEEVIAANPQQLAQYRAGNGERGRLQLLCLRYDHDRAATAAERRRAVDQLFSQG